MDTSLKHILITGASGYIGSRLVDHFERNFDAKLFLVGRDLEKIKVLFKKEHNLINYNRLIGDDKNLLSNIDIIIHLSALNEICSKKDPIEAFKVNTLETEILLNNAMRQRVPRFIYLSTAHVYGSPLQGYIDETVIPHPVHPYAVSHLNAEHLVWHANSSKQICGTILRLSNSFGYPHHVNINRWTLLVNSICRDIISKGKIFLQSTGDQQRDFVTLTDVLRGISFFCNISEKSNGDGIFNLGGNCSMTILEMANKTADIAENIFGFRPNIVTSKNRISSTDEPLNYSVKKLQDLKFQLKRNIEEEIEETLLRCKEWFDELR